MFLISFGRSILFAFQSFWRNIWLSLATIFIITLTLMSINFLIVINAISEQAVDIIKDKIDVSVYFKPEVREDKISDIKSTLETMPEISKIVYKSPEQNLEEFAARNLDESTIQESLSELEGNPLGATLVVKAKNLDSYPEVLQALENPAYADLIEKASYEDHEDAIERINAITTSVQKGGLIIAAIFVIIAILIVYNTVRIAIFTHRGEIEIMKLVGANNSFIRSPFILENIISGTIACLISVGLIYLLLNLVQPHIGAFFGGLEFTLMDYFTAHFTVIFGAQLTGIIVLNTISSSLALGRYLNV